MPKSGGKSASVVPMAAAPAAAAVKKRKNNNQPGADLSGNLLRVSCIFCAVVTKRILGEKRRPSAENILVRATDGLPISKSGCPYYNVNMIVKYC